MRITSIALSVSLLAAPSVWAAPATTALAEIGRETRAAEWRVLVPAAEAAGIKAQLIDVRDGTPDRFAAGAAHAPIALWRGPEANPGELLDEGALSALIGGLGLTPETPVALLHGGEGPKDFADAARVYWTLKSAGFTRIAIVGDGMAGWVAAGLPVGAAPRVPEPVEAALTFSDQWLATWEDVEGIQGSDLEETLLDSRPGTFLTGEFRHPFATSGGTLEGAAHLNYERWFGEDATIDAARADAPEGPIVAFCNTGVWAATNWFVLTELQGRDDVRLYAESIVGWTAFGGETVLVEPDEDEVAALK